MQRLPQGTHQTQLNTSLSVPFSLPVLFWTQIDLENQVKCLQKLLWMLRRDVNISPPQWQRRAAGCSGAPAISLWNPEAVHSSRASSGLPAEPSAKEILSVCKGSWAAAACVPCEANTSRAEGFVGELDFYRCCINFKHLPFSAWVLPLCIQMPLGMIYFLGGDVASNYTKCPFLCFLERQYLMHCSHAVVVCQYPTTVCWDLLCFSLSPFWLIGDRETKVLFILYVTFILLYIYLSQFFPPQKQRMWALSIWALNLLRGTGRSGIGLTPGGSELLKPLINLVSTCSLFSHSPCLPPVLLYPLHPCLS